MLTARYSFAYHDTSCVKLSILEQLRLKEVVIKVPLKECIQRKLYDH
jgi:hypothetical protein